ncbi:MAG: MotA/TolQ/ExbB proton channel family protein [Zetaproteobacteria bacterium]|nr:MotA/TolQ/ExbB proton channel family protein [Zetaproteobacteria bacterium]
MDIASVGGLAAGCIVILGIMLTTGGLGLYWDLASLVIVVGGALSAVMIRFTLPVFLSGLKAGLLAFTGKAQDSTELVEEIVECANIARKGSVLSLEKHVASNPFLNKAIRCMVDGYDPEIIDNILLLEKANLKLRHGYGHSVYDELSDGLPAFGMIGTVIGLVVIMANLSDPNAIGPGLAVALITTLYGSLFANLFSMPIGGKLKFTSKQECINVDIIREGVKGLLGGENPKVIRAKLGSFLGEKDAE